jgi:hypothetical protein
MEPEKKIPWLIAVTGIWLLAVGVFGLSFFIFVIGQMFHGTFDFFTGLGAIMTVPGVLCLLAGIWTLKRTHWRLAFWFSAISILFTLGVTIPPTISLAWVQKEFIKIPR